MTFQKWQKSLITLLVFSVLALFTVRVTITVHRQQMHQYEHFRNALWGDKGGYYAYLPFFISYKGNAAALPDKVVENTGFGFSVENGKLITKYPVGVALMELPFFGAASLHNALAPGEHSQNAFRGIYKNYLLFTAPFYVLLGLFLLYKSLRLLDISQAVGLFCCMFILLGTSLLYYTAVEGLMSHSFSFFLFCLLGYNWLIVVQGKARPWHNIFLALALALIVVVRPVNLLLMLLYLLSFFYLQKEKIALKKALITLFPYLLIIGPLVLLPQLLYFKYAHGSWLVYSYGKEGFNFFEPELLNLFFSPSAGLFVYVPAFVLFFITAIYQSIIAPQRFALFFISTLFISYVFSSWHSWTFGCGLGIRPFVEMIPLLVLPFAFTIKQQPKWRWPIIALALLAIVYNLKFTYEWTGCWFAKEKTFAEYNKVYWEEKPCWNCSGSWLDLFLSEEED